MYYTPAGMALIAKHAAQFKEYLAKDHEVCHFLLASFDRSHDPAVHVRLSAGVGGSQQQR